VFYFFSFTANIIVLQRMSYQVLARKWRPQVFEDVVGQSHITDILKNMLAEGRIHHGYLFCGIRGIGKTTTARILAKALNCVHGPTPEPCNQCEFCREITEGYSIDVEEIDAASNRGVDEVHVVQDNAGYAPSRSRYKVFIIDEVHMLTPPAFNALLKTLEEPPPNVVFILATTEPWKMPATILSRCQQFKFRDSTAAELSDLLQKIAQHEQLTISPNSLALIAKTAAGSVRDAENLLDQVIGFSGAAIQDDDVRYVLGIPDHDLLHRFLRTLLAHQTSQIFTLLDEVVAGGYNLRLFCMELMERIRNLVVLKIAQHPDPYLVLFDYSRAELDRYAGQTTLSELQQAYWQLAEAERRIKFSPHPRLILEMALARLTHIQPLEPLENLHDRVQAIKAALETVPLQSSDGAAAGGSEARPISGQDLDATWAAVLKIAEAQRPNLKGILHNVRPVSLTPDTLTLGVHEQAGFVKGRLEKNPKNMTALKAALREYLGRPVQIEITTAAEGTSPEAMRTQLDQHARSRPMPTNTPPAAPQPTQKASAPQNSGKSKRDWPGRKQSPPRYKPPVQVSVQDIIKMFDGEIES